MKLIIDIPEDIYHMVMNTNTFGKYRFNTTKAINNGTPFDSVVEDIKAEIEKATTLHIGMVGYVETEKVIEILDNIGKAEKRR